MLAIRLTEPAYTGFRTPKLLQNKHFSQAIAQKSPFQAFFARVITSGLASDESLSAKMYWHI